MKIFRDARSRIVDRCVWILRVMCFGAALYLAIEVAATFVVARLTWADEPRWCTDIPDGRSACCPPGLLLRPGRWKCELRARLAPLIDRSTMKYNGISDEAFLAAGSNTLELLAVHVIENGEGNDWPHGPAGNIYYDFFDCTEYLPAPPDRADRRRIDGPRVLRGPDHTHGTTYEWGADDEFLLYGNAGLYRWSGRDCVTLRLWESDSKSEDGSWGRRNDVLGLERISRPDTMRPDGVWVAFHKYTNDHPRRRTSQIAVWVRLRTRL